MGNLPDRKEYTFPYERIGLLTEGEFANCDTDNLFLDLRTRFEQLIGVLSDDANTEYDHFDRNSKLRIVSKLSLIVVSGAVTILGIVGQSTSSTILAALSTTIASVDAFFNFSDKRSKNREANVSLNRTKDYYSLMWAASVAPLKDGYPKYRNAVFLIANLQKDYYLLSESLGHSEDESGPPHDEDKGP